MFFKELIFKNKINKYKINNTKFFNFLLKVTGICSVIDVFLHPL